MTKVNFNASIVHKADARLAQVEDVLQNHLRPLTEDGKANLEVEQMILKAVVDGSNREELIKNLVEYPHTVFFNDGFLKGHQDGSWNQIVTGELNGYLSKDEVDAIEANIGHAVLQCNTDKCYKKIFHRGWKPETAVNYLITAQDEYIYRADSWVKSHPGFNETNYMDYWREPDGFLNEDKFEPEESFFDTYVLFADLLDSSYVS